MIMWEEKKVSSRKSNGDGAGEKRKTQEEETLKKESWK